jgi:DNA polymerase I-like protein with 3'-5' exonuclease and polymerase domains
MKQAAILLDAEIKLKGYDAKFVANVHDEWQIECKASDAKDVGIAGVEAIKEAGKVLNLNCPLNGDYNVGDNWSETH